MSKQKITPSGEVFEQIEFSDDKKILYSAMVGFYSIQNIANAQVLLSIVNQNISKLSKLPQNYEVTKQLRHNQAKKKTLYEMIEAVKPVVAGFELHMEKAQAESFYYDRGDAIYKLFSQPIEKHSLLIEFLKELLCDDVELLEKKLSFLTQLNNMDWVKNKSIEVIFSDSEDEK